MTREERKLWYEFLRELPYPVKRQYVIERYIADFYIPSVNLAIELDGRQHYTEEAKGYDSIRDEFISKHGIKVIRFSNELVNNDFETVCNEIRKEITLQKKQRNIIS